jgi:nitroreductase
MMEVTLTRRTAERLIEAAIAAPSVHNSQPWRFVAWPADRVIEIYADPARTLRRGDPRGRAVHIACGSALFNLRLAIAQAGYEPVARLLPRRPATARRPVAQVLRVLSPGSVQRAAAPGRQKVTAGR